MSLEFTLWYAGAVIVAESAATLSIWYIHRQAKTPVDTFALGMALGFVTVSALMVYGFLAATMGQ